MAKEGLPSRGPLFYGENGKLKIQVVHGKHPAVYYGGGGRTNAQPYYWLTWSAEIDEQLGSFWTNFYVIFAETYDESPADFEYNGTFALGNPFGTHGGGASISAWILRDEYCSLSPAEELNLFNDKTPVNGRQTYLWDGSKTSLRGLMASVGIGALGHEAGHLFGLWHDHRDRDYYIMGSGFRDFKTNYCNNDGSKPMGISPEQAQFASCCRLLNPGLDFSDDTPPAATLETTNEVTAGTKSLSVKLSACDNKGLRYVIFFEKQSDSVCGGESLSGLSNSIEIKLTVPPLKPGKTELYAIVADNGGNKTQIFKTIQVKYGDINAKDESGRTMLMEAAIEGRTDTITQLINSKADINLKDNDGCTALMQAIIFKQINAVKLLADAGADLNARDKNGLTAPMLIIPYGAPADTFKILLGARANPDISDNKGCTVLMQAIAFNATNAVKMLLNAGADVNLKDNKTGTAIMWAIA